MNIVEKALIFAAKAHHNQYRKGTDIPYITHPFAVGMILQKENCSEEVIASGILHDTLEDTETTYEDIVEQFGVRIADLVVAASEADKSLSWEERKRATIEMLNNTSIEEAQVIVGDKLHNLSSIRNDLNVNGEKIWSRFNRGKREQHWYYISIVKSLKKHEAELGLISTLENEVKGVFGSMKVLNEEEITLLFSCAYHHISKETKIKLEEKQLYHFATEIISQANLIYQNNDPAIEKMLSNLQDKGVNFQDNSDGPLLISSFCISLQRKMLWTNEEIFNYLNNNLSQL